MYNSNRDSRFGNRPSMHRATCSKCGNDCEVPFRPTGAKPVYCSKCFEGVRGRNNYSENRNDNRSESAGDQFKKQFESLNWKLDKILKILSPAVTQEVIQEKKIENKKEELKSKKKKTSSKNFTSVDPQPVQ